MRRLFPALLVLVASVAPTVLSQPSVHASPADHYTGPYFGDGNLPPGCSREWKISDPNNICHRMLTNINPLDSPKVDVLLLVPASPMAERDRRITRQVVEMWESGIDYLAPQMGLDWLAEGMDFHVTIDSVDPASGPKGEFTTYPVVDPEIVVVVANSVGVISTGSDHVDLATSIVNSLATLDPTGTHPHIDESVNCHGVRNPLDLATWENVPGFDSHHEGRSGTYVEDCGGAGGNICFSVVTADDHAPDTIDELEHGLFSTLAHEFGHCLSLGHVGDGGLSSGTSQESGIAQPAPTTWGAVPSHDIMSYTDGPNGFEKCVSTLDVEVVALRMSRYLDTNGDGAVDDADVLEPNDATGRGKDPFQVQHPHDHLYASATGSPLDCPQPDQGIIAGPPTDWTPTRIDTSPRLTVSTPSDGASSNDGHFEVSGTAENRQAHTVTSSTAATDDADNDARSAFTDLRAMTVEVTATDVDVTLRVADLGTPTTPSPAAFTLFIDGLALYTSWSYPYSRPNGYLNTASWDFAAKTVLMRVPRSKLASLGKSSPYEVSAQVGWGSNTTTVPDDRAPDVGILRVAAPTATTCEPGTPACALGVVDVFVDGARAGGDTVDTAEGPAAFSVPIELAEGTHDVRVEWRAQGRVIASRSLTVTHGTDDDGDGVPNGDDRCPGHDDTEDRDRDGVPDGCDPDLDGDGVANGADNCPDRANADQADMDGDAMGNACDPDMDGDGHSNAKELTHGTDPADPASYPGAAGQSPGTDPSGRRS